MLFSLYGLINKILSIKIFQKISNKKSFNQKIGNLNRCSTLFFGAIISVKFVFWVMLIKFDAKYSANFLYTDDDTNGVYDFTFSGNVESYVNDFVVEDSSWSITFSNDLSCIFPF